MYKVGDKVLLYTWDELVSMYGLTLSGDIDTQNTHWNININKDMPKNRLVTITEIEYDTPYANRSKNDGVWNIKNIIKCHANEYYLQKIKEELDTE